MLLINQLTLVLVSLLTSSALAAPAAVAASATVEEDGLSGLNGVATAKPAEVDVAVIHGWKRVKREAPIEVDLSVLHGWKRADPAVQERAVEDHKIAKRIDVEDLDRLEMVRLANK